MNTYKCFKFGNPQFATSKHNSTFMIHSWKMRRFVNITQRLGVGRKNHSTSQYNNQWIFIQFSAVIDYVITINFKNSANLHNIAWISHNSKVTNDASTGNTILRKQLLVKTYLEQLFVPYTILHTLYFFLKSYIFTMIKLACFRVFGFRYWPL